MSPLDNEVSVRPLEALGIDEMEERVYRMLLNQRMASADEISVLLSLAPRKVQRLLESIESKGLASHSAERPRRYIAAPPELAVESLASRRRADIERARAMIPHLKKEAALAAGHHEREQLVELINPAAMRQTLQQLLDSVHGEIRVFQRAPTLQIQGASKELPSGIRVRTISDPAFMQQPGALTRLLADVARGEEARIFPSLPIKMMLVDRHAGVVPLNADDPEAPTMLIRASSLLDSLHALFELTWDQSMPISLMKDDDGMTGQNGPRVSDAAREVIPLMAAGLNDKAIAFEAGISSATLNRRIAELMKSCATRTRFQLGWRLAQEGQGPVTPVPARSSSPAKPVLRRKKT